MIRAEFKGKTVVITGGTKGLGLATAEYFARCGANLVLGYRSDKETADEALKKLARHQTAVQAIQCDLSEVAGIETLFNGVKEATDQIDIYIHNAAATAFKPLLQIGPHHVQKTFNISVTSFILGVQEAVDLMKSGGHILSVSGMDTTRVVPGHGLLGAAKAALEQLTRYYAHELACRNIQVKSINPGFFETQSTEIYLKANMEKVIYAIADATPAKRKATLDDMVGVIAFLCSEESRWLVGKTLHVDGGFNESMGIM